MILSVYILHYEVDVLIQYNSEGLSSLESKQFIISWSEIADKNFESCIRKK
jgi:hypothetical protein